MAVHHDAITGGEGAVAPDAVVDLLHGVVALDLRVAGEAVIAVEALLVGVVEEDGAAGVDVVGLVAGFRAVGVAGAAGGAAGLAFPDLVTSAVVAVGGVFDGLGSRAAVGVRDVRAGAAERPLVTDVGVVHNAPEVRVALDQVPVRVVDIEAVAVP